MSQWTGEPVEFFWIVSWISFALGLIVFASGVLVRRSVLRNLLG